MKPRKRSAKLPLEQRPFRVLLVAASDRRQYNCPGVDSKARALMLRMADRLPEEWEVDVEDLGNVYGRARIQSCNACVSTSMALCVWPCNCYHKDDGAEPDLMWDLDLYARLDLADAWAFIAPVNWYAPPSNLKLMFDRLVCMNGGNPREELIDHKDPEKAMRAGVLTGVGVALGQPPGRTNRRLLRLRRRRGGRDWIRPGGRGSFDTRSSSIPSRSRSRTSGRRSRPLVWQCRFSGVEVPDALWRHETFGEGKPYHREPGRASDDRGARPGGLRRLDGGAFASHVAAKGKVPPGRFRAYGYDPPPYRWNELKLAVRDVRMRLGVPRKGSSPDIQQRRGLNRDRTLRPKKSERKQQR